MEERARHLALSAEGPDEDIAAALGAAALAAVARGAPAAAAELAGLAAALTPGDQIQAQWRRRADAGAYLFRAGDTARARHDLEALAEEMPAGVDRAEVLLVLARTLLHDAGDPAALRMLEEALEEASGERRLQARIHISLSRSCRNDLLYCASHAEAGLALAQQAGDPGLTSEALVQKMYADLLVGRGLDLGLGDRAMELEPEGRHLQVEERAAMYMGLCLVRADRFDEARRALEQTLRAAREEGDDSSLPLVLVHLADLECWAGNWQAAERHAAGSWQVNLQLDHRAWRSAACYARALIDAHLGRIDAARAGAVEGLSVATAAGDPWGLMYMHAVLGFAELSAGNPEAAKASLSRAADLAGRVGLAEPTAWRFHANYAEAVIDLGDLDRAEALVGQLEGWGQATGRAWTMATAARCRALLLAARGDTPGAIQALDEALGHHGRLAMPFELGRTLLVMGQMQRRAKRKAAAKQHLQQALGIFESLPAPLWVQRARAELSRIGLPPPAPFALTATEERVADLAASGHTNRQVAQALFLSPPHGGGQPRAGLPQARGIFAGPARRGHGPPETRPIPALTVASHRMRPVGHHVVAGSPSCGNTRFLPTAPAPTVWVTQFREGRKNWQLGTVQEAVMRVTGRTPRQSTARKSERAKMTANPALAERIEKRQLEHSVSWTGHERLRWLWYRLRLTVQEMNYATRRLLELQMRLP